MLDRPFVFSYWGFLFLIFPPEVFIAFFVKSDSFLGFIHILFVTLQRPETSLLNTMKGRKALGHGVLILRIYLEGCLSSLGLLLTGKKLSQSPSRFLLLLGF